MSHCVYFNLYMNKYFYFNACYMYNLFSSLAFPSSQLMSRLSTLLSSFVYFCFFLWVSPFFFVLFVCTVSFQIHMAPIFGNPFKTPTAKYLLPFMRFLNIPTSVSDIQ